MKINLESSFHWFSKHWRLIGCLSLPPLIIFICVVVFVVWLGWKDYYGPTFRGIQAAFGMRDFIVSLDGVTSDSLIESGDPKSSIGGGSTTYAGANAYQVYEANRSLQETVMLYVKFFEEKGWHYTVNNWSDFQPMFYRYDSGAWMAIFSEKSKTAYQITLRFSEGCECIFTPMTPPSPE